MAEAERASVQEFVLIDVAGQTYALDIMVVREIRGWSKATPLPDAPEFMCGVVNLRGKVLPIVDLGMRLGFARTEADSRHAVVVVQIGDRTLGLLVQGVSEIVTVDGSSIQPVPLDDVSSAVLAGLLPMSERMIGVLRLGNLGDTLAGLRRAA